jgi:hypothetical protein
VLYRRLHEIFIVVLSPLTLVFCARCASAGRLKLRSHSRWRRRYGVLAPGVITP